MIRALIPLLFAAALYGEELPITFPADGGIVDATDYGATPDDESDDTAAIQAARQSDDHPN